MWAAKVLELHDLPFMVLICQNFIQKYNSSKTDLIHYSVLFFPFNEHFSHIAAIYRHTNMYTKGMYISLQNVGSR